MSSSGWPCYLFTSLASLAIKNPSVPSCILTWLPGLMRMLGSQRNRHIILINFQKILSSCTQHANQEEWYTHLLKPFNRTCTGLINTSSLLKFWESSVCSVVLCLMWFSHGWTECTTAWSHTEILTLFFTEWYWFAPVVRRGTERYV